ncbi:MAG: hypothetical protein ACFCVG_17005 [Kineosporiaceae bacterium]
MAAALWTRRRWLTRAAAVGIAAVAVNGALVTSIPFDAQEGRHLGREGNATCSRPRCRARRRRRSSRR